jgi:tRNA uridine 5-carbamoylmethylation protein Kti12
MWNDEELEAKLSSEADDIYPRSNFSSKLKELNQGLNIEPSKNYAILIDDNNYYKSMRNEFYQIAKSHKLGFVVLYPNTPISVCQERNLCRANQVPASVILGMSEKLEEPNTLQNPCDLISLQIADVKDPCTHQLIQSTIEYSLKNPVDINPPPDRSTEIARDQRICQENEIHQADQVLRKWISTELNLASFRLKMGDKRRFSEELALKKAAVLGQLRSGELKIRADVLDEFGFRNEIVALARSVNLPGASAHN